jgi:hypothetical protein
MANRFTLLVLVLLTAAPAAAQDVTALVTKIKAVDREGSGNVEAAKAWRELVKLGPDALVDVLTAFDGANPVASNWLRAAAESIADRTIQSGKTLPAGELEKFVKDTRQSGAARFLAYEWLAKNDPKAPRRLLKPDDPGAELRREAIALYLARLDGPRQPFADPKKEQEFRKVHASLYAQVLDHARDRDQVLHIAKQLKGLGVDVDLTKRFGFITEWMLIGPFDSTGGQGFHTAFPPDKGVDLKSEYEGKDKKKVRWFEHATKTDMGVVDFNKEIGQLKAAAAFAYTVLESPAERLVDVRVGSNNAVRIYLNGAEIFFRDEYHHGMRMDQYVGKGKLRAGRNEILIKVCQNEQTESWAQLWSFQLRVCDDIGGAVPVTVLKEERP